MGLRSFDNKDLMQKYWRDNASYPFQSHDLWFLTEDMRWGYLPATTDTKALIGKVNRQDLWLAAAKAIGTTDVPTSTSRGVETMFDGDEIRSRQSLGLSRKPEDQEIGRVM